MAKIIINDFNLNYNEISEIKGVNSSVTELILEITNKKYILSNLSNKFPKLNRLYISNKKIYLRKSY